MDATEPDPDLEPEWREDDPAEFGIADMDVGSNTELFGPRAFPWIVAITCFIIAALLTVQIIRHPEVPESMLDEEMFAEGLAGLSGADLVDRTVTPLF